MYNIFKFHKFCKCVDTMILIEFRGCYFTGIKIKHVDKWSNIDEISEIRIFCIRHIPSIYGYLFLELIDSKNTNTS